MSEKINHVVSIEQVNVPCKKDRFAIVSSINVTEYLTELIGNKSSEHVMILALNVKNEVIARYTPFIGSLNQSIAHPREIMQFLLLNNSAKFVFAHNHPSGDKTPSNVDIQTTNRLHEVGELMGIPLLDSIIVTSDSFCYCSFREDGLL